MSYRVEIGSRADAQLAEIDSTIGASVERKILWLAENAAVMVHRRVAAFADRDRLDRTPLAHWVSFPAQHTGGWEKL